MKRAKTQTVPQGVVEGFATSRNDQFQELCLYIATGPLCCCCLIIFINRKNDLLESLIIRTRKLIGNLFAQMQTSHLCPLRHLSLVSVGAPGKSANPSRLNIMHKINPKPSNTRNTKLSSPLHCFLIHLYALSTTLITIDYIVEYIFLLQLCA